MHLEGVVQTEERCLIGGGVLRSLSDLVQYFSTLLLVRFYHGMR